jgi:hypothetical protein
MTETYHVGEQRDAEPSAARAWVAAALTPIGVVAGLFVAYAVAGVMGVTLDPPPYPGPTATERAIVFSIAGLVWLAAPTAAVLFAVRPARSRNRSGVAALVVAGLLLIAMLALTIANLTS